MSFLNALRDFFGGEGGLILPQIMLAIYALGILLTDFWLDARHKHLNAVMAMIGVGFSGWTLWRLHAALLANNYEPFLAFRNTIIVDEFFIFFSALFLASTALVILLSVRYMEIEDEHNGEYYALMLFATIGMMFMASGMDLVVLFMALETMAISFYVLVGYLRRDRRSNEGALKYLLLGAFSSGLLAYGFSLLYGMSGSTSLLRLGFRGAEFPIGEAVAANQGHVLILVALITVCAGLFFKIAAVPFHQWAPDVYEGAPTSITAYVSVASKAASFALLLRILLAIFQPIRADWDTILVIVAVVTMTVGNFAAITQTNIKRLLAYSSIAHVGYILLGIVAWNPTGFKGIAFYLFAYTFMNTGAFAIIILLRRQGVIGDELEDMNGLYHRSPMAAVLLLIFMLSLAGIPPTAGFMGKYFIFLALLESQRYWLAVLAVLYVVPALYYYFRIVVHAWMREATEPAPVISNAQALALTITGFVTLAAGLWPNPFIKLAEYAFNFTR